MRERGGDLGEERKGKRELGSEGKREGKGSEGRRKGKGSDGKRELGLEEEGRGVRERGWE